MKLPPPFLGSKITHHYGFLAETIEELKKKYKSLYAVLTSHEFISHLIKLPTSLLIKADDEVINLFYNHLQEVQKLVELTDIATPSVEVTVTHLKNAIRAIKQVPQRTEDKLSFLALAEEGSRYSQARDDQIFKPKSLMRKDPTFFMSL